MENIEVKPVLSLNFPVSKKTKSTILLKVGEFYFYH